MACVQGTGSEGQDGKGYRYFIQEQFDAYTAFKEYVFKMFHAWWQSTALTFPDTSKW